MKQTCGVVAFFFLLTSFFVTISVLRCVDVDSPLCQTWNAEINVKSTRNYLNSRSTTYMYICVFPQDKSRRSSIWGHPSKMADLDGGGFRTSKESVISKFNGISTPKGSYSAKTGLNCQVTSWKRSSNKQGNAHYGPRPAKVAGLPLTCLTKGHSPIRHLGRAGVALFAEHLGR